MGWDVSLNDENGEHLKVDSHQEGGTYNIEGSEYASVSITYNYGAHYIKYLDSRYGMKALDGLRAKETIPMLERAVNKLGKRGNKNYWLPTKGNAGHMLNVLLTWAKQHPNGIFEVN